MWSVLPAAFVVDLALLLEAELVVVCLTPEGEEEDASAGRLRDLASPLTRRGKYVEPLSPAEIPEWMSRDDGEAALLLCSPADVAGDLEEAYFEHHWYWLAPSPAREEAVIDSFPLRFDSNLLTFSFLGERIVLKEWYKVKGGSPLSAAFATWSPQGGGMKRALPFFKWERRHLAGADLVEVVIGASSGSGWPPICILDREEEDGGFRTSGALPEVLSKLKTELNFTTTVQLARENQYGKQTDGGEWTGLVGDLSRGDADVCPMGLTITAERKTAIDFTLGIIDDGATLLVRDPAVYGQPTQQNVWAYLDIFPSSVWTLTLALWVLVGMTYSALTTTTTSAGAGFTTGIALSYVSLLQRELPSLAAGTAPAAAAARGRGSERIAFWSVVSFSFVMFAHFSADLTAVMTTKPPPPTLKTFKDVLVAKQTVAVIRGTAEASLLASAGKDTDMGRVEEVVANSTDQMADMLRADPKVASFTSQLIPLHWHGLKALTSFQDKISSHLGLGLRMDSEFRDAFNYHILKMAQSGVLDKILHKWLQKRKPADRSGKIFVEEPVSLGYDNLFFVVLVLLSGIGLALGMVAVEFGRMVKGRSQH